MNKQSIDKRLKELEEEMLLLSDYLGEAVDKKLGARLGEIQKSLESMPAAAAAAAPAAGKSTAAMEKDLASLKAELANISTMLASSVTATDKKALAANIANVSSSVNDIISGGFETFSGTLQDTITSKLDETVESVSGKISGKIDTVSTTVGDIGGKIDTVSASVSDITGKIDSIPGTLDKTIGGKIGEITGAVNDTIARKIDTVSTTLAEQVDAVSGTVNEHMDQKLDDITGTITGSLSGKIDGLSGSLGSSLSEKLDGLSGSLGNSLSKEVAALTGTVTDSIGAIDTSLKETAQKTGSAQKELNEAVVGNLDTMQESIAGLRELLTTDDGAALGGEIARIGGAMTALSSELPEKTAVIEKGITKLDKNFQSSVQTSEKKQDELKTAITGDIKKLNDNIEVLRRMCTTDEEKFLGTLATSTHNLAEKTAADLEELSDKVKQWLLTLDNNLQVAEKHITTKQDEMKKILSFDIKSIAETADAIKTNADTLNEERTLGTEMVFVGDKVDVMSGQVPDIQEKVTNLSDQLDRVTAEVMRMRWYVIGAATVSIIVLVSSFFM